MRSAVLTLVLAGCVDYQLEPYAQVQTRDEGFDPAGGASEYSGETYAVGVRYVPPTRISYIAPSAAQTLLARDYGPSSGGTTVNLPAAEKPDDSIDKLAKLGKDADGNWSAWGVCALLVVGFAFREWRRPKRPEAVDS